MKTRTKFIAMTVASLIGGTALAADMASPPNSLVVDETGKIGIGTATPTQAVQVVGTDPQILVENNSTTSGSKVLMMLESLGPVNFKLSDTTLPSPQGEWTFRTGKQGSLFAIGKTGSGVVEMQVFTGGNMKIAGALTQRSSRTSKEEIESVKPQAMLKKVLALPVAEWSYKHDGDAVRHVGPMAEDFYSVFHLGADNKGISSIDTGGVALAAIQGLNQVVESKEREIADLKRRNDSQTQRLDRLEQMFELMISNSEVAAVNTAITR